MERRVKRNSGTSGSVREFVIKIQIAGQTILDKVYLKL
jgi:hypothetical protein